MANIHQSITELVGHTPLVELKNYEENLCLYAIKNTLNTILDEEDIDKIKNQIKKLI